MKTTFLDTVQLHKKSKTKENKHVCFSIAKPGFSFHQRTAKTSFWFGRPMLRLRVLQLKLKTLQKAGASLYNVDVEAQISQVRTDPPSTLESLQRSREQTPALRHAAPGAQPGPSPSHGSRAPANPDFVPSPHRETSLIREQPHREKQNPRGSDPGLPWPCPLASTFALDGCYRPVQIDCPR